MGQGDGRGAAGGPGDADARASPPESHGRSVERDLAAAAEIQPRPDQGHDLRGDEGGGRLRPDDGAAAAEAVQKEEEEGHGHRRALPLPLRGPPVGSARAPGRDRQHDRGELPETAVAVEQGASRDDAEARRLRQTPVDSQRGRERRSRRSDPGSIDGPRRSSTGPYREEIHERSASSLAGASPKSKEGTGICWAASSASRSASTT